MKLAVVLSTYNGEKYLREQIDSILAQSVSMPLELVIRDDGSSDGTKDILDSYAEDNKNIKVVYGSHIGLTASYFVLLKNVFEDPDVAYVSLSDQDDVWLPGKIETALSVIKTAEAIKTQPILYGCSSYLTDENLNKTGKITQRDLKGVGYFNTMIQNILLGHNQVMNRALLEIICKENPDLDYIYAHDYWITKLASIYGVILFDNQPHTLYRQHSRNELGFGTGPLSWVIQRARRAFGGEINEIIKQRDYFLGTHSKDIPKPLKREMVKYKKGTKSLGARIWYAMSARLYRQRMEESSLFRLLYILGMYK